MAGREISRSERLSDLAVFQRLLAGSFDTAILFDEFEDVAWQLINRGGSKLYLNRLLETNPVPVIWTSNNIFEIDAAVLRRMSLIVELKAPPIRQRERILRRLANRYEVELDDHDVHDLAAPVCQPLPRCSRTRCARPSFPAAGRDALERAASGHHPRALRRRRAGPPRLRHRLRSRAHLRQHGSHRARQAHRRELQPRLLAVPVRPARHRQIRLRPLSRAPPRARDPPDKRASDLLAPYIGQSEKNIAEAFESAREAQAMLIFDEANSLLFDRREAVRSWEVSQVNEMLTWMEQHPLPFCCTTNMMERIDSASLRRFTFHILFQYLNTPALTRAYAIFFQMADVPPDGLGFANLTPGDFAQARRQADMLGIAEDVDRVIALDRRDQPPEARQSPRASIGFVRQPSSLTGHVRHRSSLAVLAIPVLAVVGHRHGDRARGERIKRLEFRLARLEAWLAERAGESPPRRHLRRCPRPQPNRRKSPSRRRHLRRT